MIEERCRCGNAPDPLFVFSTRHPPSPTPLVIRDWWTSSAEQQADLDAPEIGRPPLVWVQTRPCALGVHHEQTGMGSQRRRPFLKEPMPPPILHIIAMQWSEWTGRTLIQQKKTKQNRQMLRCYRMPRNVSARHWYDSELNHEPTQNQMIFA